MSTPSCHWCGSSQRQVKNGRHPSGSQRYLCRACGRRYTPAPAPQGYPLALREQALRLYADGMTLRRSARHLRVVHQTVANGVAAQADAPADALPDQPPQPDTVETAELDALYTFIGHKKTPAPS